MGKPKRRKTTPGTQLYVVMDMGHLRLTVAQDGARRVDRQFHHRRQIQKGGLEQRDCGDPTSFRGESPTILVLCSPGVILPIPVDPCQTRSVMTTDTFVPTAMPSHFGVNNHWRSSIAGPLDPFMVNEPLELASTASPRLVGLEPETVPNHQPD